MVGSEWGFALSMGFTDIAAYFAAESAAVYKTVFIWIAAAVIFGIVGLGWQACEGKAWAFIVGIVVLLMDSALLLIGGVDSIISIAFHLWACWCLFSGVRALNATNAAPPI